MKIDYPALVRYFRPELGRVRFGAWVDAHIYDLNPYYITPGEYLLASQGRADKLYHWLLNLPNKPGHRYPITDFLNPPAPDVCYLDTPLANQEVWVALPSPDDKPVFAFKSVGRLCRANLSSVGLIKEYPKTVAKAMLGVVISQHAEAVGFTLGTNMVATELLEHPIRVSQAMTYKHACGLGHGMYMVPDASDWLEADIKIEVEHKGKTSQSASAKSTDIRYQLGDLVKAFTAHAEFPDGAILLAETGIHAEGLHDGDVIKISATGLGTVSHPVRLV